MYTDMRMRDDPFTEPLDQSHEEIMEGILRGRPAQTIPVRPPCSVLQPGFRIQGSGSRCTSCPNNSGTPPVHGVAARLLGARIRVQVFERLHGRAMGWRHLKCCGAVGVWTSRVWLVRRALGAGTVKESQYLHSQSPACRAQVGQHRVEVLYCPV